MVVWSYYAVFKRSYYKRTTSLGLCGKYLFLFSTVIVRCVVGRLWRGSKKRASTKTFLHRLLVCVAYFKIAAFRRTRCRGSTVDGETRRYTSREVMTNASCSVTYFSRVVQKVRPERFGCKHGWFPEAAAWAFHCRIRLIIVDQSIDVRMGLFLRKRSGGLLASEIPCGGYGGGVFPIQQRRLVLNHSKSKVYHLLNCWPVLG